MADYIYLDHAAATPLEPSVLAAMMPFLQSEFYNPSATYAPAREVRRAIDQARAKAAAILGCRPAEIIFTAGGTEANNLAINGVMAKHPDANMLVSAIEHDAVLQPSESFHTKSVMVQPDGRIDLQDLESKIDAQTVLISVMLANNEIGVIQPVRDIALIVERVRRQRKTDHNDLPLYLHTDACQAAPYLDLHVARSGVDLMTLNGSKMYGPKQSGILYIKAGIVLAPLIKGGGQEQGLRSGTENVAGIIGIAEALELVQNRRHDEVKRLTELRDYFINSLQRIKPDTIINGSTKYRLPNNVHVTFPGTDNERLIIELDLRNIAVAAGSACRASAAAPSHVLSALGLDTETAQSTLRFTMGASTSKDELDYVIDTLATLG